MADGWSYNSAGNDVVELEAMRKDSLSWQPCQVSICTRGMGLVVVYRNNNFKEIITDKEEILARIRVRSTTLQGDDCSSIEQGERVLATKSSHVEGVFYDAGVEEAVRVRHSKRIHCRCSFRIKWLHQALQEEETLTVPSSSIMKLATESIHLHPTISTFFSMLESSNGLDAMPCSMTIDGMNSEMDINMLLEKQIKEIGNVTDISQDIISTDFVFRQEVDLKGPSHSRIIDASLDDPHVTYPTPNKLKDSEGSEKKQPKERTAQIPPVCIPSIEEEFTESKLFLSPLAARAALASLRSEFPRSPQRLAQSKGCSFSPVDGSSNIQDFSLNLSATLEGKSSDFTSIVKTLFPTSSAPQIIDSSSGATVNEMDKKKKHRQKKITQPTQLRFTRAQAQKINGIHETSQVSNSNETQLWLTKKQRVTRSTVEGEKIDAKEYNEAVTDNVHTEFTILDTSSQNIVASPISGGTSKYSDKDDKSILGKDGVIISVDVQKGTFIQNDEKRNFPKRMTCAAAKEGNGKNNLQSDVRKEAINTGKWNYSKRWMRSAAQEEETQEIEKNSVEPKLKLMKSSSAESNANGLELENSLTCSEQFNEDREKKRKTSTQDKGTPKCSENGVGARTRQKFANSKQQDTQSSERLGFRPRTRSQIKA